MSKILRRPMFRGGPVDSRGTGITSGLMDGGRVGLKSSFPGTVGEAQEFLTGGDIVDLSKTKFSAGMPFPYQTTPLENIKLTDTSVEEETPKGDVLSRMTDYLDIDTSSPFEGVDNFEDLPKSVQNISSKTDFDRYKKEQADVQDKTQSAINAEGYLPIPGPEKGVIETDGKGGVKLVTDPTGNVEQKTEMSAKDIVRENAELFKEFLSEGNEKKLRDARIQDLSDLGLDIFAKSQQEGATVGSTLGGAAANLVGKDSRVDKAKAQIDKSDQTAVALAINDYIAGKRSKEQVDAMLAKSDLGFAQAIALADYKKKKDTFVDVVGELGRGMSKINAIAGAVQKLFDKIPNSLTEKDIKLENFNLKQQENVGEYFIYPDGRVTTIIASGDGFIEDVVYSPQGIMSGG